MLFVRDVGEGKQRVEGRRTMSVELVYVDGDWMCGETGEWLVWLTMAVDGRRTPSLVHTWERWEGWSSQNVKKNKGGDG